MDSFASTLHRRVLMIRASVASFKGWAWNSRHQPVAHRSFPQPGRRHELRRIAAGMAFLLVAASAGGAPTLPQAVARALRAAAVPATAVGIWVQAVDADRPALEANAGTPLNPASVMKLVTTFAALDTLGPAYRWKTEVFLDGRLRDGVLEGNLVLKGGGDPKLDYEQYWRLLRALRGKGLREVRGDLVLDRSHFDTGTGDPGGFDGEALRPYNVLPDALLLNYKSMRFGFVPDPEQGTVGVFIEPPGMEVRNTLRLVEGTCHEGRAFRDALQMSFETTPARATFAGRYVARCGEKDLHVALLSPDAYAAGLTRALWQQLGGTWQGSVHAGRVPPDAQAFHVHESPPLVEALRDINKLSNNVMARQLFLTFAAEATGPPARLPEGTQAVKRWLAGRGIEAPELIIENGAGLSRISRISARNLAQVLTAAWNSPLMPEFISSLPLAGTDGTMRKRLKGEGIAGRAHLKTGLLAEVRAVAGYVFDRSGRRHVVVMLVNHPNAGQSAPAIDALLRWVWEKN